MAGNVDGGVLGLVPRVLTATSIVLPGVQLGLIVGEDREGRDAVFLVVLVLVVAPDNDHVRVECVELLPGFPELIDHFLAMGSGVGLALVVAPLLAHLGGPVLGRAEP